MDLNRLACQRVQDLTPYQSARRIGGVGRVYLNANESPLACDFRLDPHAYNRYPECQPPELLEAYAAYAKVSADKVIVGRGSDEIIGLLCRAFCEPGQERVLIAPPTYGMYSIAAQTNGIDVVALPPLEDFQPDVKNILAAIEPQKVKIVFICSPNNPTGTLVKRDSLIKILEGTKDQALVVVDEAYIEFSPKETVVDLLAKYQHLVITRTLSKAFGLAGLRCGFALADPEIIKLLLKVIDPYPICAPVAQVATEALKPANIVKMQLNVAKLNEIRGEFVSKCESLKMVVRHYDCCANYVLLEFTDGEAVFAKAKEAGFILRDFNDKPRLKNCIRITVGTKEEMDDLFDFFKGIDQ